MTAFSVFPLEISAEQRRLLPIAFYSLSILLYRFLKYGRVKIKLRHWPNSETRVYRMKVYD